MSQVAGYPTHIRTSSDLFSPRLQEKRNAYLCLNPYLSPEAERVAHAKRETEEPRPDKLLFQLRKARTESTGMAPTYCEDGFKHLVRSVDWEHA